VSVVRTVGKPGPNLYWRFIQWSFPYPFTVIHHHKNVHVTSLTIHDVTMTSSVITFIWVTWVVFFIRIHAHLLRTCCCSWTLVASIVGGLHAIDDYLQDSVMQCTCDTFLELISYTKMHYQQIEVVAKFLHDVYL